MSASDSAALAELVKLRDNLQARLDAAEANLRVEKKTVALLGEQLAAAERERDETREDRDCIVESLQRIADALGVKDDKTGAAKEDRLGAMLAAIVAARAQAERRERALKDALNATCECGGRGPKDDPCLACEVWHRYRANMAEGETVSCSKTA